MIRILSCALVALAMFWTAAAAAAAGPEARVITLVSDAPEPYPLLTGGSFSGPAVPDSPDPLVRYRWAKTRATDGLQIYALTPAAVAADLPANFLNLDSLTAAAPGVTVNGIGSIRVDFGQENAGWLEFDSPDLSGTVEASISEYNEPAVENAGPAHPRKTSVPVRYGHTYRLELNKLLYEGVRFGWIHVRSFDKPWQITAIRAVCQVKPANYTGSFSCSDRELTRIWYTGVYTVKLNLLKDYFGAILMDRGDRFSWTGDAYPAQAAALASLDQNDFVKTNLLGTSIQSNGIASYSLYWVLSLVDYYNATGDDAAVDRLLDNARGKLDAAYVHFDRPPNLEFFGWEERLGAGFEHPNIPDPRRAYSMLTIHAWRDFARAMGRHGRADLQTKYLNYADEKTAALRKTDWMAQLEVHSAADAVNAGFTTPAEQETLFKDYFDDRIGRLSYSPFNEYSIIQAMSAMNRTDEALSTVKDCWGGQIRYGGTSFFEVYDPSWNQITGLNGAVPNTQCGYTSLCHPWGSGVVRWLTEETLGIKPATPGFATYTVCPHPGRTLTRVSGQVQTPHGMIAADFDMVSGVCSLSAPPGTVGELCIPKVEREIESITINGKATWANGRPAPPPAGFAGVVDDTEFVRFTGVRPGLYDIRIAYHGVTPPPRQLAWDYPIKSAEQDATTRGNWGGKYGRDGFVLCNYDQLNGKPSDRRRLPGYVSTVKTSLNKNLNWQTGTSDVRAPAGDPNNAFPRNIGCIYTQDPTPCLETMTIDVKLTEPRPYQIALYFVDWDRKDRRLAVDLFDRQTLKRLAPVQMVSDFAGGKYLIFRCDRSVRFRIDQIRGDNAALSGLFFDPVSR